jgi:ABC-2 type transport system permease protein
LPRALHDISDLLPLSYAVDAMTRVTGGSSSAGVLRDVAVVAGFVLVAIALGSATLRRRTP